MTSAQPNMTPASNAAAAKADADAGKQILLKEIGAKWSKFSQQDLSALKSTDDLVTQLVAKYGLDKTRAQSDADLLLKGRRI